MSVPSTGPSRATWAPAGSRPRARAVTDLPDPDSPTRPTASPGRSASETSRSTARLAPFTSRSTVKLAASSSGGPDAAPADASVSAAAWSLIRVPLDLLSPPSRLTAITTVTMHRPA